MEPTADARAQSQTFGLQEATAIFQQLGVDVTTGTLNFVRFLELISGIPKLNQGRAHRAPPSLFSTLSQSYNTAVTAEVEEKKALASSASVARRATNTKDSTGQSHERKVMRRSRKPKKRVV